MTSIESGMRWFKQQFGPKVTAAINGTPYNLNLITAIAIQETGYVWLSIFTTKTPQEVLAVCVGDSLDRSAFPKNKADLLGAPNGAAMFAIAHQALLDVAQVNKSYRAAAKNPDKFCHGYGMLQYDLQFFKDNPSFFLQKRWNDFDAVISLGVKELEAARARINYHHKTSLTDDELIHVAIAYNRGTYDPRKGLKQGYKDSSGKYYGEYIDEYYRLAKTVS
jgi:hypothetical protein